MRRLAFSPCDLMMLSGQVANHVNLRPSVIRVCLAVVSGNLAVLALFLLFAGPVPRVHAAPVSRPLGIVLTATLSITHTSNTTHQMRVFANGQLTNRFLTSDGETVRNAVDINGQDPEGTTIAVRFDQHITTGNSVDVGVQGELVPTIPISLETASTMPGFSEDTYAIYASQVLSYQITQRTLATTTNNCVIIDFSVQNTGSSPLTGGRFLLMLDLDSGQFELGDNGYFDPAQRLAYLVDYNDNGGSAPLGGYAIGVSLLRGNFIGFGINADDTVFPIAGGGTESYPTRDVDIEAQLINPSNTIVNTPDINHVVWMVVNLPDLSPGQATGPAFGLCAVNIGGDEDEAEEAVQDLLKDSIQKIVDLSITKAASSSSGSQLLGGDPLTYTISLSNTGNYPLHNVIITDTIPVSTSLNSFTTNQGTITATDRLITVTIGQMNPISPPVTINVVVTPQFDIPDGTIISNQAFVSSDSIVTTTNVVTHEIIAPVLRIDKQGSPNPVLAGGLLTYTIVISNEGQADAVSAAVSDTLPFGVSLVPGTINLEPDGAGTIGPPPSLINNLSITAGEQVTLTFTVALSNPWPADSTITNTATVTAPRLIREESSTVVNTVEITSAINIVKTGPATAQVGNTATFTFTVTNIGNTLLQDLIVEDDVAGVAALISGDSNGDNQLDLTETWIYNVDYTILPTVSDPLTNTVTVTATDGSGPQTAIATDTHTTLIEFGPVLTITKQGPITANIGNIVVYTFTVSHANISDGSPVISLTVNDDVAGQATLISGDNGNDILEASETWLYTVNYTPVFSDPISLTNTGTVQGEDRDGDVITATASHTTIVTGRFNPLLQIVKTGPVTATVNQTVIFTFTVSQAPGSDNSALSNINLNDSVAGSVTQFSGDTNGNSLLEGAETWIYTTSYTIKPNDPSPLQNIGLVTGLDQENDLVSTSDSHSTTLSGFAPVLFVDKDGPTRANVDDTVVYTFTVINFVNMASLTKFNLSLDLSILAGLEPGDGSGISINSVIDNVAGTATYVSGDGGAVGLLEGGEGWVYTATYVLEDTDPDPLVNMVMVQGVDREGDPLMSTALHSTAIGPFISPAGPNRYFFPIIFK